MALSRCSGTTDGVAGSPLQRELCANIGNVVTVFTASGGCSGNGFTGVLAAANSNTCRLITSLPSAPSNPFGLQSASGGRCPNSCGGQNRLGTTCVIPLSQICAVVSNKT